jgi:hypothetical protein
MAKRGEKRERRSVVLEPDAAASMLERRRFTSRYHRIVMRNLRAGSAASPATRCTCRLARPCRIQTCGDGSRQGYTGSRCFRYWRSAGFKVYLVKMRTI